MRTYFKWSLSNLVLILGLMLGASGLIAVQGAAPAYAQDSNVIKNSEFGAELKRPDGWDEGKGNEKALAVFTHNSTQSQIEVVPTKLMTADVADAFFKTFYNTLSESNFQQEEQPGEKTYGEHKGKESVYKFSHSGVTLNVRIFSFVQGTTAWLVIGYWQDGEAAKMSPAFANTITSLKLSK